MFNKKRGKHVQKYAKVSIYFSLHLNLECLIYAHDHGAPWHPYTTFNAAYNGDLECLKYAHENGCPWHSKTTNSAALNENIECRKYIYEHCGDIVTWEESQLENNFERFSKECQNYINRVEEEWKAGLNRPGTRTKPARR